MSKELTVKEQQILVQHAAMADDIFDDIQIDSTDIIIPKLLLMQPTSRFVNEADAKLGDFMNSVTGKKLGSILEPVEIVPFYHIKSLDILNADDNNTRIRNEPFTPANATLPWEDTEGGVHIKRVKRLDFFCLLPKMLDGGSILPMVVSFRSTSYNAGANILTAWSETRAKNQKAKEEGRLADIRLPFHQSFILSGNKLTNEKKQSYATLTVQPGIEVEENVQRLCLDWLKTVKTQKSYKVDESDEATASSTQPEAAIEPTGTGKF